MKLTTSILAMAVMVGGTAATQAVAQNADAIDQARSIAKSLQTKQQIDSNAASERSRDAGSQEGGNEQAVPWSSSAGGEARDHSGFEAGIRGSGTSGEASLLFLGE